MATSNGYKIYNPRGNIDLECSGSIDVHSKRIINLPTPSSSGDAVNLSYVNSLLNALTWKVPVIAATTSALPANTYDPANGTITSSTNQALTTLDGVTLTNGKRILVKNETVQQANGIYVVTSTTAPFVLTRSSDANSTSNLISGTVVNVEQGTINAELNYNLVSDTPESINDPVISNNSVLIWEQFNNITSTGDGLYESSPGVYAVKTDGLNSGISVTSDGVKVVGGYINNSFTTTYDGALAILNFTNDASIRFTKGAAVYRISRGINQHVNFTSATGDTVNFVGGFDFSSASELINFMDSNSITRFSISGNGSTTTYLTTSEGSASKIQVGTDPKSIVDRLGDSSILNSGRTKKTIKLFVQTIGTVPAILTRSGLQSDLGPNSLFNFPSANGSGVVTFAVHGLSTAFVTASFFGKFTFVCVDSVISFTSNYNLTMEGDSTAYNTWTVTPVPSGTEIRLSVVGENAVTINWTATMEVEYY